MTSSSSASHPASHTPSQSTATSTARSASRADSSTAAPIPLHHGPISPLPWYRSEPWLVACLAAFVPLALAIVLGRPLLIPLLALAGLLLLVSVVLLVRGQKREPSSTRVSRER